MNRLIELEVLINEHPELDIDRLDCKIGKILLENGISCRIRDHKESKYGSLSIVSDPDT